MKDNDDEPVNDIDHQIRINELREKLKEMGAEFGTVEGLAPEIEEQFLENVLAYETGEFTSHYDQLSADGVDLPDPESLTEETVGPVLAGVIESLAQHGVFLDSTDHLSDLELYARLYDEALHEEVPDMPPSAMGAWHIDMASSGSDEDTEAYLRYYASEEVRSQWAQDFPDEEVPPHEELPYHRDKTLPRPQFPAWSAGEAEFSGPDEEDEDEEP